MSDSLSPADAIYIAGQTQLIHYVTVAAVALLSYDYIIALEQEVRLIWKSRWNCVKVFFLLTRYTPFLDATSVLLYLRLDGSSPQDCIILYKLSAWLMLVGIAVAEVLLTVRTLAVWENSRKLQIALPIFYLSVWASIAAVMGVFLGSVEFVTSPIPFHSHCLNSRASSILSACWVLTMVYDAGILILMAIRGLPALRSGGPQRLATVVYRDGLIYYFYLFALSLINVIVILILPHDYVNLLSTLERVMYSILTCRAILHIREQLHSKETDLLPYSDIGSV